MSCRVLRRDAEVVIADDAFCFAESRNGGGDVFLEVDPLAAFGDGGAQEQLPGLLGSRPATAVGLSAAGDDDRARPVGQEALEVYIAVDVIQPKLDELRTALDEVLVLGNHVPVTTAADTDAEHAGVGERLKASGPARRAGFEFCSG